MSAPPRAAPLLAQAGDCSREAYGDDRVEHPDVDPELERIRRADSEQLARKEALLDLAPLRRRVAGPVWRQARGVPEPVGRELVDQLCGAAALGEDERPQAALDQIGHQLRRFRKCARPLAQLLVDERWVPERNRPLRLRGSVLADDGEV